MAGGNPGHKVTTTMESPTTDGANAPIIGLVLLVGLTVILSATVAVLALETVQEHQSDATQPWDEQTPDAEFDLERIGENVIVTHAGGDEIDATDLEIRGDLEHDPSGFDGYTVSEGDSVMVTVTATPATVRVVWATPYADEPLAEGTV